METDPALRRRLLDFEIGLDRAISDEAIEEEWGATFLCPSTPLVWDNSWIAIERSGVSVTEAIELSDVALGGAGFEHRTIVVCDEADGERLLPEFEDRPDWEVEIGRYMTWRGDSGRQPAAAVRETRFAEIEPLRRQLSREDLRGRVEQHVEETAEQLLELERRYGAAGGDRWFVADGPEGPAAACRLLAGPGIQQVEDVATLESARERGLAQAVVLAAVEQAKAAEPEVIFLVADGRDWPQLMYAKLGFEPIGDVHIFRRNP